MVHFVGAGPGDVKLITVKGRELLESCDVVIYAGSLVNPALLLYCSKQTEIYDSSVMTLDEVIATVADADSRGLDIVRLHTGDPSIYGAIREQMDELEERGIDYEVIPGVSSMAGAAAAIRAEYTLPGVSQTIIMTRCAGRTPVGEHERLGRLAEIGASMAIFLSAGLVERVERELLCGAYERDTPAAVIYKATWQEQRIIRTVVGRLAEDTKRSGIKKTAIILVGDFLGKEYEKSRLYDPGFSTEFRPK